MTSFTGTTFHAQETQVNGGGSTFMVSPMSASSTENMVLEKDELISLVCAALMSEVVFSAPDPENAASLDRSRDAARIATLVHSISAEDGEFVLKLALYVRRDLSIRLTAAFLVALCAYERRCQPFLACYMKRIILLPSDWLNIANIAYSKPHLYLLARDGGESVTATTGTAECCCAQAIKGIPNALRDALAVTFTMFDEFSLAKYNTERATKRSGRNQTTSCDEYVSRSEDGHTEARQVTIPSRLTFKHLIRHLHLSHPVYAINCLLGKRYPNTVDEFVQRGLDEGGIRAFNSALCGQRMRLPTPETWERRTSREGNTAAVWDDLVARKCLPFMAAMRNLRNIVLCGCNPTTHDSLLQLFSSEEHVFNSRQFPHRFMSAYEALDFDPEDALDKFSGKAMISVKPPGSPLPKIIKKRVGKRIGKLPSLEEVEKVKKMYRGAMQQAAEISARLNIIPISGRSLVILNITRYDLPARIQDLKNGVQLAVSFYYACEDCSIILLCRGEFRIVDSEIRRENGILSCVENVCDICRTLLQQRDLEVMAELSRDLEDSHRSRIFNFPYLYLDELIEKRVNLQALIVMDCVHSCYSGENHTPSLGDLPVYLERLRRTCNENLLFVALKVSGSKNADRRTGLRYQHKNDFLLTGFSAAALRVVAEGVSCGPRRYVERIDQVYDVNVTTVRAGRCKFESDLRVLREVQGIEKERSNKSTEGLVKGASGEFSGSTPTDSAPGATLLSSAAEKVDSVCSDYSIPPRSLQSRYKNFRFFLSSTFLDMENERNTLVLDVFPQLRRWAAENNLHINIIEVDLRWGITEDSTRANLSPSVCLNEVSRCAPFFLGVLGSRYGYRPPTLFHTVDDDVDSTDFAWIQTLQQEGNTNCMSVTEMEMRHAIFAANRRTKGNKLHTMAFLVRDNAALVKSLPPKHKRAYAPDTPTAAASIERLTKYLEEQGAPVIPYTATYKQASLGDRFSHSSLTAPRTAIGNISIGSSGMLSSSIEECPLDMADFSRKAFVALKSIILRHMNLPLNFSGDVCEKGGERKQCRGDGENNCLSERGSYHSNTLYSRECMNQLSFSSSLLKKLVPPQELMGVLVRFACTGRFSSGGEHESIVPPAITEMSAWGGSPLANETRDRSNVLVIQAQEGDGTSTVAAALAMYLRKMDLTSFLVTHFACQAGDGSLQHLAYYISFSLIYGLGLQEDFRVQETDSVTTLIQLLPRVYEAAGKKRDVCVILDGMNRSSHAPEMLQSLSWIIPPEPIGGIRFVVTLTTGNNPFSNAFALRVPPPFCVTLPHLTVAEGAELVRKHLASSGKRLQESFHSNQLRLLLRKADASHASYLTYAIMYLRLFSTFDTLTNDITQLPSTLAQLQVATYERLEERFGKDTCRAVLVSLYIASDVGGLNEFSLYRLVSNVASASRLVVLLSGTCLRIRHRRITVTSTSFASSIAKRYLSRASDVVDACLNMLVSELYYKSLSLQASRYELRCSIQSIVDGIKRDSGGELAFDPRRYTAGELLTILHLAKRAKEYDVLIALLLYVPLLENLVVSAGYLQRLLSILSQSTLLATPHARKLDPVVDFIQRKYHVLVCRPFHLRQCIRNNARSTMIFYGLSHSVCDGSKGCGGSKGSAWVKWINNTRHIEEGRLVMFPSIDPVKCFSINSDGEFMAGGGDDMNTYVMPHTSLDQITASLKHSDTVTAVTFLTNRPHILVTGSGTGVVRVWNSEDGRMLQQSENFHRRRVSSLSCHPVSNVVCSGSNDCACAFWPVVGSTAEASTRSSLVPTELLQHHKAPISSVAYHISGAILATGSWEGKVYFIDVQQRHDEATVSEEGIVVKSSNREQSSGKGVRTKRYTTPPYSHCVLETWSPVRALAFVPSMVVTCAAALCNGDICLYDYASATCGARFSLHAGVPITALAFSPDAKWMASADERGSVLITYAGIRGTVLCSLNGHRRAVTTIHFHPQNPLNLYTVSLDGTVRSWSVGEREEQSAYLDHHNQTGAGAATLNGSHAVTVTACAVASDGSFFVTAAADGVALVFTDRRDDRSLFSCLESSDNEEVVFEPQFTLLHDQHRISYICIGLQNTRIMCGTAKGEVFVWDSTPGLNRREGRLLQRIRVAEEGAHPVVYIGCESCRNTLGQEDETNKPLVTYLPCARITAITTSGMVVSWVAQGGDSFVSCLDETQFTNSCTLLPEGELDCQCADGRQPAVAGKKLQRSVLSWVGKPEADSSSKEEQSTSSCFLSSTNSDTEGVPSNGAEEIVCAVPLLRATRSPSRETHEESQQPKAVDTIIGLGESHSFSGDTTTGSCDEYYIVVGRRQCHFLSARLCSVIQLPMFTSQSQYNDCSDDAFSSVACLPAGGVFLCVSNALCVKETRGGGGEYSALFAVSTSCCMIWLLEVTFSPPVADRGKELTAEEEKDAEVLMREYSENTRLSVLHSVAIYGPQGKPTPVDSLNLAVVSPTTVDFSCDHAPEEVDHSDVSSVLLLTAGCRDGSVRIFVVRPFQNPSKGTEGEVDASQYENAGNTGGKSDSIAGKAEGRCVNDNMVWQERGVFFASSSVTAVVTMRKPIYLPTVGPNSCLTVPVTALPKKDEADWGFETNLSSVVHLAGDCLGNVYQLQLKREETKTASKDSRGKHRFKTALHCPLVSADITTVGTPVHGDVMDCSTCKYLPSPSPLTKHYCECANEYGIATDAGNDEEAWRSESRRIMAMFAPSAIPSDKTSQVCEGENKLPTAVSDHELSGETKVTVELPPFERILQKAPSSLSVEEQRAWVKGQQSLLVEAIRVQRCAVKAREVLAEYSQNVLSQVGLQ
ncbi:telomerase-associated protein, putative [Trypanosoma brucei gambiense DAL972]|uniref:Telomerase-associated protein, putative n=1 Tax=Trypanosoma brucei gambiense (strain MHOM/CI/86/DAL972) TaxID=679716 RepID=C9ZRW4_TRYB9|nr:telomerase-associated protein, putative [Trypanosoma brucei gambiense DAL972]CBH12100.1 telomerase-associated protein, putative [Trypanosoma brucei gambiense DAL972]|eukprot:XP_011774383.1 telomerase-associated protein, putative [Trypanosoma brucei gambiense DAL972]